MRYLLTANNTLIVRGPGSVRLLNGDALVLGGLLQSDRKLVVREEKQIPIEASSDAEIEITLGESGKVFEVTGSTIPESWKLTVDALAEMEQGKLMVIGATDVGKSTLCTFLANELLKRGLRTCIIDADIGQADIGPPTTVASAIPTSFLSSLVDLTPEALIFIGDTSPSKVETKLIKGIQRLLNRAGERLSVINTDGWILDPAAILYKINLIRAIQPDLVIGISAGTELDPILSAARARSMKVQAPENVLPRSRTDRREIRNAGYRRFLAEGSVRTFPIDKFSVRMPNGLPPLQRWKTQDLQNLIVGFLDGEDYLLQIGVLLDFGNGLLKVYSRPVEDARHIEVGYVKLLIDGTELGYLEV